MYTIEDCLNYKFNNSDLLKEALTHKSFANEKNHGRDNERLEFLGDAVLQLAVTDILMERFPDDTEGDLSKKRAYLVGESYLAPIAKSLKIQEFLYLGKGEKNTGGQNKPRLLASALEAIIGAIYMDSDLNQSKKFIKDIFNKQLESTSCENCQPMNSQDFKTQLQEKVWQIYQCIPQYKLTQSEGPDHNPTFYMSVSIDGKVIANGFGKNKKEAQQMAAQKALTQITS